MTEKAREIKLKELRSEVRKAALEGASIEFKPGDSLMSYHFKLRDLSPSGLGILAKKDSNIFKYIKVGDILSMKYYKGDAAPSPQLFKVEIRHISQPANGKPYDHMIIGLLILETIEDQSSENSNF
ncbi:MAG: PilZ domain-containing protein [Desulfobacteraceae bacterium]|nr:PilZ domain-containing protein [Desulfobacteraceae bacterium]